MTETDDHKDEPIYLSLPEAEVLFSDIMQEAATGGAEFIITIDEEPAVSVMSCETLDFILQALELLAEPTVLAAIAELDEADLEEYEILSEFSDAFGQTYVIEAVDAVQYEDGWHAVPSSGDETWFDPSQPVEAYQAISIRISKTCWRQHMLRGLPGGLFVSEGKDTVKILTTYDDLWSIVSSLRWLRENPESPANNVPEEQKHPAMLLRKAAHQLDGRLHRIILAWDNAVEDFGLTEDDSKAEDLISAEAAEISQELTNRHNEDVQSGRIAVVSLSEGAAMLLEEIGVEPETPHPEAPGWGPGKHKVTQGTLNDLEQRSINITDPELPP